VFLLILVMVLRWGGEVVIASLGRCGDVIWVVGSVDMMSSSSVRVYRCVVRDR